MAFSGFVRKVWQDRVSEFPLRRRLTDTTSGVSQQVTVARDEGTVTTQGDTFDAANMNGLEARIASSFTEDEAAIGNLANLTTTEKSNLVGAVNEVKASVPTFVPESLGDLDNVQLSTSGIPGGSVLSFDGSDSTWKNKELPASDVKFSASQIVQSTNVQNAIDFLGGETDAMRTAIDDLETAVNSLFYYKRDTIDLRNSIFAGIFTGGQKSVIFYIPLNKPLASDILSVSLVNTSVEVRHPDGGYIIASNEGGLSDHGTISCTINQSRTGVLIALALTTADTRYANNTPIAVRCYGTSTITFS